MFKVYVTNSYFQDVTEAEVINPIILFMSIISFLEFCLLNSSEEFFWGRLIGHLADCDIFAKSGACQYLRINISPLLGKII